MGFQLFALCFLRALRGESELVGRIEVLTCRPVRLDDQALIQRFLQEDARAVGTIEDWIARAASPFRHRLAFQWEDVLQEIRLEVVRMLREQRFRGEASLKTYLCRTAGYICIDHLRRQSRWRSTELDQVLQRWKSPKDSPLDRMLRQESWRVRLEVLDEMPSDCRRMWRMILNGRSYRQMSRRMGVKEGTLRVRVLRCRQAAVVRARERIEGGGEAA